MKNNIYLSFIVLAWNSEKYIVNCLNSIDKIHSLIDLEIIIVDNGSTDATLEKITQFKNSVNYSIKIISLKKNIGTTRSRNLAIKECRGNKLVFLDSDIEFTSHGFKEMLDYLNDNVEIGILSPLIKYPNGIVQQSCKKFPTLDIKLLKLIDIFTFFSSSNRDYYLEFPFSEPHEVDTSISAFWLMDRNIIDLVGYFDENIFYSPEDIDYCVRIWLARKKVLFYPYFQIMHHTQQISHKFPFKKISFSHLRGLFYYFNKYGYFFSYKKIKNIIKK